MKLSKTVTLDIEAFELLNKISEKEEISLGEALNKIIKIAHEKELFEQYL